MPRFQVRVTDATAGRRELAVGLLVRRYPEIDLVGHLPAATGGEVWLCDAPAAAHLHRWLAETGLAASVTDSNATIKETP